jgi:hypothetical protein
MKEPLLDDNADVSPRRRMRTGTRQIDKVRRASGEFNFSALLSGTSRPAEPAELEVEDELSLPSPSAEAIDTRARPAYSPMPPSVLEEQAEELRKLWATPSLDDHHPMEIPPSPWERGGGVNSRFWDAFGITDAPPAPWERGGRVPDTLPSNMAPPWEQGRTYTAQSPMATSSSAGTPGHFFVRSSYETPYWESVQRRFFLCLWVMVMGMCLGAGVAPYLLGYTPSRTNAAVKTPGGETPTLESANSPIGRSRVTERQSAAAPNAPSLEQHSKPPSAGLPFHRMPWHIAALLLFAVLWVGGAPFGLRGLQTKGFVFVAAGVLGMAVWMGGGAVALALESRSRAVTHPSASEEPGANRGSGGPSDAVDGSHGDKSRAVVVPERHERRFRQRRRSWD